MEGLSSTIAGLAAVVLFTAFVKIATSLTILKQGLGLNGAGFGAAVLALSLLLSIFVSPAEIQTQGAISELISGKAFADGAQTESRFRPFIERQADSSLTARLDAVDKKMNPRGEGDPVRFATLLVSFLLTQLKQAFELGLLFIIPFVVIDLLVVNVLMSIGITQLPVGAVSLPLKLLLFVVVDGWTLVTQKLLGGFV